MSAKTVLAINGSPRRKANTAELLQHALRGAADAGAATEMIHLYTLNFKGCTSCFVCKRKDKEHGVCAMKDDLSPVLERVKQVDAVIFGAPIYFMNLSSGMLACLERLFFSNYLYSREIPTVFPKILPSAYIYTMNATEEQARQFQLSERLHFLEMAAGQFFGMPPRTLWAYDTYQFKDYSQYESSIFSETAKAAWRKEQWPRQCAEAYSLGSALVGGQG
ncbi:MAG: flavodoxin family protein [Desulfovibrio sp.]|nr:flavodoxin family protein [Desulfovibrio sp.]